MRTKKPGVEKAQLPVPPEYIHRIRRFLAQRGISQNELSRRAGVSNASVTRLLKDGKIGTWDMLCRIAAAAELDPPRLVLPDGVAAKADDVARMDAGYYRALEHTVSGMHAELQARREHAAEVSGLPPAHEEDGEQPVAPPPAPSNDNEK